MALIDNPPVVSTVARCGAIQYFHSANQLRNQALGHNFTHLHLTAPLDVRTARSGVPAQAFAAADGQPVESGIDALAVLATHVVENAQSLSELECEIVRIVGSVVQETS